MARHLERWGVLFLGILAACGSPAGTGLLFRDGGPSLGDSGAPTDWHDAGRFSDASGPHVTADGGTPLDADAALPLDSGAAVDGGAAGGPYVLVIEAETFEVNDYWARCPGAGCGNDLSVTASGGGHLITMESPVTSGPEGHLSKVLALPASGVWYLWAKSARVGSDREWRTTFGGVDAPEDFGLSALWQRGGSASASDSLELTIRDTSPDGYWAYPDAFIVTDDPAFDPNTCPSGGVQASDCLPGNHRPLLFLRPRDAVDADSDYTFDAVAEDPDGDPLTFHWEQVSGPSVGTFERESLRPTIHVPAVPSDTDLSFRLVVRDPGGAEVEESLTLTAMERVVPASGRTCAQVQHVWPCVEVSACGFLRETRRYYLVTADLQSESTCLVTTGDVVIDLNGHTLTYDVGYEGEPRNGGFEESEVGATAVEGWDLSGAPGAKVVSTWEMPLIGDKALSVPANGEVVSSWVHLPVAGRTYRGQIVQRGKGQPVTLMVERQTSGAPELVCTRAVTDPLGGGKAAFCNFHGQPSGFYRLRVRSTRSQYYDDAAIVPARSAGIGAVRYFTSYEVPDRPSHACNLDDGTCNLPDVAGQNAPTATDGVIDVRNGAIVSGSRSMKSWGVFMNGGQLRLRHVTIRTRGVSAKTVEARYGAPRLFHSILEADNPWVIDREDVMETAATVGSDSVVAHNRFLGGQGCLSLTGSSSVVRDNEFVNRAKVTNHYALNLGRCERTRIERNRFNCDPDEPSCPAFSGSGILGYRTKSSEILDNDFYIVSERCDAEYVEGDFTTNAIRLTDYNSSEGNPEGVYGVRIAKNRFHLRGVHYPQMPKCLAFANGVFYSVGAGDNFIEDNVFESENRDAKSYSFPFYIGGARNGGVWRNNVVRTNDKVAWITSPYGMVHNARLFGNTFERTANGFYTPAMPEAALRVGYCCGYEAEGIVLRDNALTGGFENDAFWLTSNQRAPYSVDVQWTATVTVKDSDGAPVTGAKVILSGGGERKEGTTDSTGVLRLVGTQVRIVGINHWENSTRERTEVTPHTLTATAAQGTATMQVTLDRPITQELVLR